MSTYRKLATICCAAVLTFGLAACGGGGDGDGSSAAEPPPLPPAATDVALPDGHGLMPGTTTLPQGDTMVGDTTIMCPSADGCMLTVSRDPVTGAYTATATGGAVTVAVAEPPPPPVGPDPALLAAAQDTAMLAWQSARDALARLAGKESANPTAYQRAMNAVADAKAAYDKAAVATTLAEAERHRDAAVTAGMEATTQAGMVVASYEAPAFDVARMAAKSAADAAMIAYDAAKVALAAVEAIKGVDMASYDMAMAQVAAAKAAYDAAMAASAAAAAATVLADAQAQQQTAEDEMAKAGTANMEAMKYAGMVQTAESYALTTAQTAAQTAYDAAKVAYDAAAARVVNLEAKKADNIGDYIRAMDALVSVKAAHDAAKTANDMARAATTSTDAATHQGTVEAQKVAVDTRKMVVDTHAGLVEASYGSAQAVRDQMIVDAEALTDAQKDAMAAATAARTAATDAREQATKVSEALGPNSASAMDADAAATAAEMAAMAAEEASARAQEDTDKADAQAEQQTAEGKQTEAEMKLADATELARQAGVATAGLEQLRIELARDAAEEAKDAAAEQATMARDKATMARTQANNARADADMAMRARTDHDNADMKADAAEAAATAAETAAMAAETASNAAEAEYMKTMAADVTSAAARMARDEARKQRGIATANNSGDDGAAAKYMEAMTAAMDAKKYAAMHFLGLLKAANAVGVTDAAEQAAAVMAAAMAVGTAAEATNNGSGGTTVVSMWPADVPATDDAEAMAGMRRIVVSPEGGTALRFTPEAIADDPDTEDDESMSKTATMIDGLPDFMHGYSISDDGTHAIVFTDITQAEAAVEAVTLGEVVSINNRPAVASRIVLAADATSLTGASYDHDGNPDTNALPEATFACGFDQMTACSFEITGGKLTSLVGYVVSVTAAANFELAAEKAAVPDASYLAFGVWLQEDGDGNAPADDPAFGAFQRGGSPATVNAAVTGTAKYMGAATGVYTAGSSVDYFQGAATLTAEFGTAPDADTADTAFGSITGMINKIVAGGVAMSDVIHLNDDEDAGDNITATGSFSGDARMGAGTTVDAVTTYPYNGSWSGQFYNGTADDRDTAGVNESLVAPDSAAGTFGVTGTMGEGDDAVTRSYVGAFGAQKQ